MDACEADWKARNDTLNAAYTLLGSLGVRWLGAFPGSDVVPDTPNVSAPVGGRPLTQKPVLIKRQIRHIYKGTFDIPWLNRTVLAELAARETRWLQRMRMGQHNTPPWGQAFGRWWNEYGAQHPEWFALNPDGQRGPFSKDKPDRVKMCVSNAGLWQAVADEHHINSHNSFGLSAAEDDSNWGFCTCSKCKALDAASRANSTMGRYSDRYANFWNHVWQLLAKASPTSWVTAYAYDSYRLPPAEVKLEGNILIGYVGFSYPALANETALERSRWTGWRTQGAKGLFLRPNSLIAGSGMPWVIAQQMTTDFQYVALNGLLATDFDSLMNHWGAVGPTYYSLARLHWDPTVNTKDIFDEYYNGFGGASQAMRAYVKWLEQFTHDSFTSERVRFLQTTPQGSGWFINSRLVYTTDVLAHASRLLHAAEAACKADSDCLQKVILYQYATNHSKLVVAAFNAIAAAGDCYRPCLNCTAFGDPSVPCLPTAGANVSTLARILSASRALTAYRVKIAHTGAVNVYWEEDRETVGSSYFPGRDYNGAKVTADAARVPTPWKAVALLAATGWEFALDPLNHGVEERWFEPTSSASDWNATASVMRGWEHEPAVVARHHVYEGAAWYRTSFVGSSMIAHDDGGAITAQQLGVAFSAANGSLLVWLNGAAASSIPGAPGAAMLWKFEASPQTGKNTLVVRVDAKGHHGGLCGRVFVAAEGATRLLTDDDTDTDNNAAVTRNIRHFKHLGAANIIDRINNTENDGTTKKSAGLRREQPVLISDGQVNTTDQVAHGCDRVFSLDSHGKVIFGGGQHKLFFSINGARSFQPAYTKGPGFPTPGHYGELLPAGDVSKRDFGTIYTMTKTNATLFNFSTTVYNNYSLVKGDITAKRESVPTGKKLVSNGLPQGIHCNQFACSLRLQGTGRVTLPDKSELQSAIIWWGGNARFPPAFKSDDRPIALSCPPPATMAAQCTGARRAGIGDCLLCLGRRFPACDPSGMDYFCSSASPTGWPPSAARDASIITPRHTLVYIANVYYG